MTRRTWFRTLAGAFATLATGLGLRKVEKKPIAPVESMEDKIIRETVLFYTVNCNGEDGFEWTEMPMPDFQNGPPKWLTYDLKKPTATATAGTLKT